MNRRLTSLLTLLIFLTACAPALLPAPTETAALPTEPTSTPKPPTATLPPTATPAPTFTAIPKSNRTAAFTIVEKTVDSRPSQKDEYAPASIGLAIPIGGQARTGEDGRARLDLSPDGTIVRVAPNTIFTLPSLEEKDKSPFTLIELLFGQLYIILSGGELEVKTPSGVAAVRGSMMGVSYNPNDGTMTVTCLEGHCSLKNDSGIIELIAGQAADIRNKVLSSQPRNLTDAELLNWVDNAPEVQNLLDRLPAIMDRISKLLKDRKNWKPPRP